METDGSKNSTSSTSASVSTSEAEEYVESVMSSQRLVPVDNPVTPSASGVAPNASGRKRHMSELGDHESSEPSNDSNCKKAKVVVKARRTLYSGTQEPTSQKDSVAPQEGTVEGTPGTKDSARVGGLITNLSADMHMLFSSLSERVDKMESCLEQKIANRVAQVLDKRVNSEMKRVRTEVDTHMNEFKESIREEVREELNVVNGRLESLSGHSCSGSGAGGNLTDDITLNIVVRNFPEREHESIAKEIDNFIKDGLKLSGIACVSAERKQSHSSSRPGVVVAKLWTHDDKRKIMDKKSTLKSNSYYSNVYIQHDLSKADRVLSNNFRTILSALDSSGLAVRGHRVVRLESSRQGNVGDTQSSGSHDFRDRSWGYTSRDRASRGGRGGSSDVGGIGVAQSGDDHGYGHSQGGSFDRRHDRVSTDHQHGNNNERFSYNNDHYRHNSSDYDRGTIRDDSARGGGGRGGGRGRGGRGGQNSRRSF